MNDGSLNYLIPRYRREANVYVHVKTAPELVRFRLLLEFASYCDVFLAYISPYALLDMRWHPAAVLTAGAQGFRGILARSLSVVNTDEFGGKWRENMAERI